MKGVFFVLAAAFVLALAAEAGYRGFWRVKCAWTGRQDTSGYFDLYVVGDWTAAGQPYAPGITLSSLVSRMFAGRVQGRPVREFDLTMRDSSVYSQSAALEYALRCRAPGAPGVVLVYPGHADALGECRPGPGAWLRQTLSRRSLVFNDLAYYAGKVFPFHYIKTRRTYEYHVERIVAAGLKKGVLPILSTVVVNVSDMGPGLFLRSAGAGIEAKAIVAKGLSLKSGGRREEEFRYYLSQAKTHPEMRSYLKYRAAKTCQETGRFKEAAGLYSELIETAELDDNYGRPSRWQDDVIRALGVRRSIPVVEAVELFKQNSPHGLVGNNLFTDGIMPNMAGYLLLAGAYARHISTAFNEPVRMLFAGPEDVFESFSYTKRARANALVRSGRWLFNVSARHSLPGERLAAARRCFKDAISLDPYSFSAWLALGLTEAAMRGSLLSDEAELRWLKQLGATDYHTADYNIQDPQLPEILVKLRSYGVPAPIVEKISMGQAAMAAASGKAGAEKL